MDVVIKNVPEGAETQVREMASVAVERFLRNRDLKVAEVTQKAFEDTLDNFRVDNSLQAKFKVVEAEPIKMPMEEEKI